MGFVGWRCLIEDGYEVKREGTGSAAASGTTVASKGRRQAVPRRVMTLGRWRWMEWGMGAFSFQEP